MDKPLWGLRVDGPLGRRFLRGLSLTAAMPLRVVEGASKFIEGASLYKTFTNALRAREMHSPFGGERSEPVSRMRIKLYDP